MKSGGTDDRTLDILRDLCACTYQATSPDHALSRALLYLMCIFAPLQVRLARLSESWDGSRSVGPNST